MCTGKKYLLFLLLLIAPATSLASPFLGRTPEDTYRLTVQLAHEVQQLRQQNGVQTPWPDVTVKGVKSPRHEYQKALEVLSKINRYRRINKLDPVSIPLYPSREVTPDEVFDFVQRLVGEVRVLLPEHMKYKVISKSKSSRTKNYRQLWRISRAFDALLGVRGFSPGEVFSQSEHIVELVRFLRATQNISDMPEKPQRTQGKHPNHALKAAYRLLGKIHQAEHHLWMNPVRVPAMEKRVITPTEVFDTLQTVIAELQRIKFRLGVEGLLSRISPDANKTPDDVIQNLRLAAIAMPKFPLNRTLIQYNPATLEKTPNDVFTIAVQILQELKAYKKTRHIRVKADRPPMVDGLKPRHVYQKTLESLKKVVTLRQQAGFGVSAIPLFPMRPITPNDVFALVSRLDRALNIVYARTRRSEKSFENETFETFKDKTPSDVFHTMWQISYELDTILGTQGQTANDVFQRVTHLVAHIKLLGYQLGYPLKGHIPSFKPGLKSADVIAQAKKVLKTIGLIEKRAGMFGAPVPAPVHDEKVIPNDVFNLIGVIGAEFAEVEVHFGISKQLELPPLSKNKTPSDVYQKLGFAESLLEELLGRSR